MGVLGPSSGQCAGAIELTGLRAAPLQLGTTRVERG